MRVLITTTLLLFLFLPIFTLAQKSPNWALALHGGAGTITRANLSTEKETAIRQALDQALAIGEKILREGGTALDAVEAVIHMLEDSPHFNAGKGALFTADGTHELDAAIMDGSNRAAGAATGLTTIKHPISAARGIMQHSPHVMLSGKGAETFARKLGLDTVPNQWFDTPERKATWEKMKAEEAEKTGFILPSNHKMGTVGCVALDQHGNLAAGTSTGGMTMKRWGRVGDAPVIGAGTWADNNTCAISCTGHGEYFIRWHVAADVAALMEYKKWSLLKAANHVVLEKLVKAGGEGGLIAVDKKGNIAMPFNSEGMYRASSTPAQRIIAIYKN